VLHLDQWARQPGMDKRLTSLLSHPNTSSPCAFLFAGCHILGPSPYMLSFAIDATAVKSLPSRFTNKLSRAERLQPGRRMQMRQHAACVDCYVKT
jgi:hypothetical protein